MTRLEEQEKSDAVCSATQKIAPAGALYAKRVTDVAVSAAAVFALAPLMVLLTVAIKMDTPGPALFKQKRIGKNGELFEIYKFRTMRVGTPNVATDQIAKLQLNPVTRVGSFLRRTSLDELPQLFNVLKGEMSIVGPRPALFNQYELTDKRKAAGVLRMLPGITGWAQVNGRDELPDDEKVKADAFYCDNWNYLLDWKIIVMTFRYLFDRTGVN